MDLWGNRHRRMLRKKARERRRIRGTGTWTAQQRRISRVQAGKTREVRGTGSWTAQARRGARYRQRAVRRQARRFGRKTSRGERARSGCLAGGILAAGLAGMLAYNRRPRHDWH